MKRIKKIALIMLAVALMAVCFVFGASALDPTGQCGDNVYWNYDSTTGEIIISGEGTMEDTHLDESPFYHSDIKSVIIEDGVTTIGDYAFFECTSLTSVTIPDSVTTIGGSAFCGCDSLTSITIPDSVTTIGGSAFEYCDSLTSVTIGDSVTTIGNFAFYDCDSLTSVTIPDSVTTIGNYAFDNCTSLTSVTIPDSVTTIGNYAFDNCSSLTSITIPDSVTTIGGYAFYNTGYYNNGSNWENNVLYIGEYLINANTSLSGSYSIKEGTKLVADCAFFECTNLASVTIPDSVIAIGNSTFGDCTSLTSVTIPDGVTTIGDSAFSGCHALTSATIGDSVTTIGQCSFGFCEKLTSVTIGDSVTTIGDDAFIWCYDLRNITIPDSVKTIGEEAFAFCGYLKNVRLSDKVEHIGNCAFACCFNLDEIIIPDNVKYIGDNAFTLLPWLDKLYIKSMDATFGENINSFEVIISGISQEEFIEAIKYQDEAFFEKFITNVDKPIPTGTIYCHAGSTAEAYAIDNDAPYVLTHFFEGEWNYDYDKMIRFRKCIHCDELEVEQLENTEDEDVEIIAPVNPDVDFTVDVITDYIVIEDIVGNNFLGDFEIIKAFDINLNNKDGVHVQPNGTVKVKLPLDWSKEGIYKVYRVNDDGTLTDMNAYRQGSHMVFETDHFSVYVIVDESEKTENPIEPEEPDEPIKNCSHMCHKGGISGFIWDIVRFFWKLFKMNPTCQCGVAHY